MTDDDPVLLSLDEEIERLETELAPLLEGISTLETRLRATQKARRAYVAEIEGQGGAKSSPNSRSSSQKPSPSILEVTAALLELLGKKSPCSLGELKTVLKEKFAPDSYSRIGLPKRAEKILRDDERFELRGDQAVLADGGSADATA